MTTLAWFSPLPPIRSGVAAYSAELLARLKDRFVIDVYPEAAAHDFLWRARRRPYDLIVYQLGNAPCHDYMWAYLASHPGLVVLHDARLHHARARRLLAQRRVDDYRAEFRYDHPDANAAFAEYAVEGLGGSIYYFWPMLRVVMRTARAVAVHNTRIAGDLREQYPEAAIETIRMGVEHPIVEADARTATRRALALPDEAVVFAAFGKVTAEKRIGPILHAVRALVDEGCDARLLLVGDADGYPALDAQIRQHRLGDRVRVTGHVADDAIGRHLAAADVCLCLRWPTAQETSASWLRCLAAGRPTVITDLAHLVDVPSRVAVRVDLLDEEASLLAAMRKLAADPRARAALAQAGHAYWSEHHTLDAMAADYERVIARALSCRRPEAIDLPAHFTDDYSQLARSVGRQFRVDVDILRATALPTRSRARW